MTQLKDVLHLYLGCEVDHQSEIWQLRGIEIGNNGNAVCKLRRKRPDRQTYDVEKVEFRTGDIPTKPILRKLESMTETERREVDVIRSNNLNVIQIPEPVHGRYEESIPLVFAYFLSKHFDLFGLIESNQAIDQSNNQL
jgi:hypothetical protein